MSEKTQPDANVIKFVKIKSWYIPEDAASYQLLRSLKVPLLKIHQDFIPTLKLATSIKGVRAKSRPFSEVQAEFLDKVGAAWLSKENRKCKLTDTRSAFTCKSNDKNRQAVAKLDSIFQKFYARWGFSYNPVFSETASQLKIVMDYKFDPSRNPVVVAVEEQEEPMFEFEIGFTKIRITFDVQRSVSPLRSRGEVRAGAATAIGAPTHILEVFTKAGGEWVQIHTASFTPHSLGDMTKFLGCLAQLHSQHMALMK